MESMRTVAVILALILAYRLASAQPPDTAERPAVLTAQVAKLVVQLDSDRFEVRSRAAIELERLIDRPDAATVLAAEFDRALADAQTSFEVRSQLRAWTKRLPTKEIDVATEEAAIEELLRAAVSNSYATRTSATRRLAGLRGSRSRLCR